MPRERRQNGWVEVTGKKPKTWTGYWYEYTQVDGAEKRQQRSKVLGLRSDLTKGAAEEALRTHIRKGRPASAKANFSVFAELYLEIKKADWNEPTRAFMGSIFHTHIIPAFGNMPLNQVRKSDVDRFMGELSAKDYSESMVAKCLIHTRAVFEMAVDDLLLDRNPAKKSKRSATKAPSERFLSMQECEALLRAATGRDYLILRLLLTCALRPSELFGLRVNDILSGELKIDEAIVRGILSDTKTDESNATIPLPPSLEQELLDYLKHEESLTPQDFLFPSATGTAMRHENYLDRRLQVIGRKAGINDLNFQVLRRTTATQFQRHGKVKDAQALLRHATADTTLKHYQKTLDSSLVAAVHQWDEEINALLHRNYPIN
jgi:integrase